MWFRISKLFRLEGQDAWPGPPLGQLQRQAHEQRILTAANEEAADQPIQAGPRKPPDDEFSKQKTRWRRQSRPRQQFSVGHSK